MWCVGRLEGKGRRGCVNAWEEGRRGGVVALVVVVAVVVVVEKGNRAVVGEAEE